MGDMLVKCQITLIYQIFIVLYIRVYRGSSKRGDFLAARQVNSKVHTGTTNDHTDQWEGRTACYTGYLPRLYILVLSTMSYKIYRVSGYCMNVSGDYSYGLVGTARE